MEIGSSANIPALPGPVDIRTSVATSAGPAPAKAPPDTPSPDGPGTASASKASADARVAELADAIRRRITVDEQTHRIVYESLDERTGEVVYQLPDARSLRLYAEQMKASHEEVGRRKLERLA